MVYCGRCGRSGHYISSCKENYNIDGERISKITSAEKERSMKNKQKAVLKRNGSRWTEEEETIISNDIDSYIKKNQKN